MSKNKLKKFEELETFQHVYQPPTHEILDKDFSLKGHWKDEVFKNSNSIILELGCGKGEYTINQALLDQESNYIGVDIKGSRIWTGAKTANEKKMNNVAFLRARIEFINSFFSKEEIDEIWVTFPDPQLKRRRNKKRLTGSLFLNRYNQFLKNNGLIHLKTDNAVLYHYTKELAIHNQLELVHFTEDLYASDFLDEKLSIKTYYEKKFLEAGLNIHYLSFKLPADKVIVELPGDD